MARGSVRRADTAWGYWVDAGLDPATGKRRQISKQGFKNRRDAETALNAVLKGLEDGSTPRRSTTTLGDFLDEWLDVQRQRIRPTTWHGYEMAVERIKRHLGKAKLQALSPLQIEKFYSMLLESGRSGGGALAAKTVRNTHVVLRKALADAERLELVHRNAAGTAHAPSVQRPEHITWSSDELKEFLSCKRIRFNPTWRARRSRHRRSAPSPRPLRTRHRRPSRPSSLRCSLRRTRLSDLIESASDLAATRSPIEQRNRASPRLLPA